MPSTDLPSSDTGDDDDEGEGDHGKGHEDANFQKVILEGSLVLTVDCWTWLRTERISHGCRSFFVLLPDYEVQVLFFF